MSSSGSHWILGINAYHAGASACLIRDGVVVAAAEEERFNRKKYWAGFPVLAARWVLEHGGITPGDLTHVGISRNPSRHLLKKVGFVLRNRPSPSMILDRLRNAGQVRSLRAELASAFGCQENDIRAEVHRVEHHRAHLASAFLVSPFEEAAVLSIDGMGDFCSTMSAVGRGNRLTVDEGTLFPHSLGFFYTAISQWLGFPGYGDEGKVMALAGFGQPIHTDTLRRVLTVHRDGSFELNLDCFSIHTEGVSMSWDDGSPVMGNLYSDGLVRLLGEPRQPRAALEQRHYDVAASLQALLEEAVFARLGALHDATGLSRLCLAGGVALNSAMNGRIPLKTPFKEVWVQPAAGDAGTSLGVCYHIWNELLGHARSYELQTAALGPAFSDDQIETALRAQGLTYRRLDEAALREATVDLLVSGGVAGWFQGRMEWGPRALGQRSILADPRRADVKETLNARIKHREAFRPFAPSILEEYTDEYFEQSAPDPFMVKVYPIRVEKRDVIPGAMHVDGTGRLQTVSARSAPAYRELIEAFRQSTGVPVVVNTSFNDNEPIVCAPAEAIDCFRRTHMDGLAIGSFFLRK